MDHFKLLSLQSEFPTSDGIGYEGLGDGRGTEEEAMDGRDEHGTELVADYLRLIDEDLQGVVSKLRFALQEAYIQLAKSEEARRALYQENVALKKALTLHSNLQPNATRFDPQPQSIDAVSNPPYTVSADTGSTNTSTKQQQHPAPKTWASLATANKGKWGNSVAQDTRNVNEDPQPHLINPAIDTPYTVSATILDVGSTRTPTKQQHHSAPRSWASLAAANKARWGTAVALDVRGMVEVPSSSSVSSGEETPISSHVFSRDGKPHESQSHPLYVAATQVTTTHCFLKGVTAAVTEPLLAAALSKFGDLTGSFDIVHTKACAFVEFATVESARRAIIASLNTSAGGGGGVWVDVSSNPNAASAGGTTDPSRPGQIRVFVETKKIRSERPLKKRGGVPQGSQRQ